MARVETVDSISDTAEHKRRLRLAHARPAYDGYELVSVDEIKKVTITRLRLLSVAKVAVVFWMCAGLLAMGGVLVSWLLLTTAGVTGNFERFVTDMTGVKEFHVVSGTVIGALILLLCLGIVVGTVMTVVAAAFYNIVAMTIGGVEVVGLEESLRPVPAQSSNGSNVANGPTGAPHGGANGATNGNGQHVADGTGNGHASGDVVLKS